MDPQQSRQLVQATHEQSSIESTVSHAEQMSRKEHFSSKRAPSTTQAVGTRSADLDSEVVRGALQGLPQSRTITNVSTRTEKYYEAHGYHGALHAKARYHVITEWSVPTTLEYVIVVLDRTSCLRR